MALALHSRSGNAILGILGVLYLFSAISLLVVDLLQTWGAASLVDRAVQAVLVLSAVAGLYFVLSASRNLGLRLSHRESRLDREGAAFAR